MRPTSRNVSGLYPAETLLGMVRMLLVLRQEMAEPPVASTAVSHMKARCWL